MEAAVTGPRRQGRGQRRIDAILDAAASLFAARGIEGTTMSAIATASRTAIGSLYQFFPNRRAIVDALAERYLSDWHAMRSEVAERRPAGDLAASVDVGIDARVRFHVEHAAIARLLESNDETARAVHALQTELESAVAFLTEYAPGVAKSKLRLYAQIVNAMVNGVTAAIVCDGAGEAQRNRLVGELKAAVTAYLSARLPARGAIGSFKALTR